ncbi:MAG: SDR family NAD(P)-dependent oxidoreductase, partial [Alphaproteobacteria bacterium]|nr:SDR family NAD(P)-dependent oxidoreductase [Alphaproteobacteria bacterium]
MDWKNRHVWIIGASAGIGRALAVALHAQGASLALSARNREALGSLNAALQGRHAVLPCDVTDIGAVAAAAAQIQKLDIVIFMAGEYVPTSVADMTKEDLVGIIDTNLKGAFHALIAILPRMRTQKNGMIALCGSVAGYRGLPKGQPYSATKAAMINLAETLYLEEKPNGIDVRLISPGFVRTRMTEKNAFAMPAAISPEEAAGEIVKGLE